MRCDGTLYSSPTRKYDFQLARMSIPESLEAALYPLEEEPAQHGPRPPTLPGSEWDASYGNELDAKYCPNQVGSHHRSHVSEWRVAVPSPSHTPRKSPLHHPRLNRLIHQPVLPGLNNFCGGAMVKDVADGAEGDPAVCYESESSASSTPPFTGARTPSCLKWAQTLRNLLQDSKGVELFKHYLELERCEDCLNFWFACEGLKKQSPDNSERIQALIKVIYRKYLRSHNAIHIGASTRKNISDKLATQGHCEHSIFDDAQHEVEQNIAKSTYPNFLKSEIYLQYVRSMQNGFSCHQSDSSNSTASPSCSNSDGALETVLEDCELNLSSPSSALPLTTKHLIATQKFRARYSDVRRPEASAGLYLQQNSNSRTSNPYHAMYGTVIPISAQDSELQSLSSGAHTDDTVSLTDSSVDGVPTVGNRKYLKQQHRAMRQNANQNKDLLCHRTFIPRTQRLPVESISPSKPDQFAATLIQKLEAVKRSQESQERVDESLRKLEHEESKCYPCKGDDRCGHMLPSFSTILLTATMKDKLAIGDESNDQSILDEHVSRIWNDSAHQTPTRSPGRHSSPPRSHSPERRRVSAPPVPNPYSTKNPYLAGHPHHRHRKDRDVLSMFSNDSGAVPDSVDSEGSLCLGAIPGVSMTDGMGGIPFYHKHGHHHSTKSKVVGEFVDHPRSCTVEPYGAPVGDGQKKSRETSKRSGKKSFLDSSSSGIDSGVSLAYEPNSQPPLSVNSREKVMSWVLENEKYNGSHPSDSEKDSSTRHKKSTYSTLSSTSPGPNRSGRIKKPVVYNASRSGSLERGGHVPRLSPLPQPNQPFMSDPSMPILPPPNTTTQLEEARRRLEDDTKNKLAKSKSGSSSKDRTLYLDLAKGNRASSNKIAFQGTSLDLEDGVINSKKSSKKPSTSVPPVVMTPNSSSSDADITIVGYHFVGESVPYRSKLPGKNISLKQFKSLITKKGSFRYFFKSESDDFGTGIVYEEVSEDSEVLPLWEGKIFARLESID